MAVHLLLPLAYGLLFFRSFPNWVSLLVFVIGCVIGFQILFLDRFVHAFYLFPDTEFNTLVRELWKKKEYVGVIKALMQAGTLQQKLLTRSIVFFIVYLLLTIFVLTSTGSVGGIGLMLGMGLHYTYDFWRYSQSTEQFRTQYLWQLKRPLSEREIRGFVVGWTVIFVVISLLVMF